MIPHSARTVSRRGRILKIHAQVKVDARTQNTHLYIDLSKDYFQSTDSSVQWMGVNSIKFNKKRPSGKLMEVPITTTSVCHTIQQSSICSYVNIIRNFVLKVVVNYSLIKIWNNICQIALNIRKHAKIAMLSSFQIETKPI